jgi:hypothetical protein
MNPFPQVKTCESTFLSSCSAASTGRCTAKKTPEVAHYRLVSPPRQCCHSLCFVCGGISGQEWHNSCSLLSPYSPDLASWDSFPFAITQADTAGKSIWWHHHGSKTTESYTSPSQNTGLLRTFSTMARTMGSLYEVVKEVLWSGQHRTADKYRHLGKKI